jgi:two-component system chemotaxis sensor kinase CheA
MSEMDEIVREFLVESNEGLDQMDRDLVELEKRPDSADLLASIFRAIHTIKGTSGVLGFQRLEALAHVGENLLSRLRDGKLRLNPTITTVLLGMLDAVRARLADIEKTGVEQERDDSQVIAAVSAFLQSAEAGEANKKDEEPLIGELLVQSGVTRSAVTEALRQQREGDGRRLGEILISQGAAKPEAVLDALNKQGEGHSVTASSNIRVDVGLLDKVMNLVGELVLARNQVLQFAPTEKDQSFLSTAQRLNLITTELQEAVMKTRMQPIGNVWNKFPRLVRDVAAACGKQVRIQLEGSDTELDKTILESIKDPLTHVVRNSIDHGIEPPEVREAAGKPREGTLLLRSFHEGGQVNIEISDDGSGIDLARVKQKAAAKGLITLDQAARMNEREVANLIFLPGLSTAEKVTNVSGRGVGMDVVKTNVEKIGGTVDVHTVQGQGTTLKIKIPLTLAIIPALVVTSGGERFAIPQISLVELVRLEGHEAERGIEDIQGAPVYRLRGNLLPLVYLNRVLSLACAKCSTTVNIVVLHADGRQFGLVVDHINDTEEIVVKPLGKHLKGVCCFAGATIMGDGQVALILDVLGLAQKSDVISESQSDTHADRLIDKSEQSHAAQQWLVFKTAAGARMAVPLSIVARLEEIKATTVEKAGDREVVQYRGQIMPLLRLNSCFGSGGSAQDPLQVIVHTQQGRSIGLVVDEIVDVVEEDVAVNGSAQQNGFVGSAVIQKHVTDILDVPSLLRTHIGQMPQQAGA